MLPKTRLKEIDPIDFCRQIKAIETGLSIEQVIWREERGTFKEYCLILSRELEIPYSTIRTKWGSGIEFPNMPIRVKALLKFVLFARKNELRGAA